MGAVALCGGTESAAKAHPGESTFADAQAFLRANFVADLHAHPAMKTGFFRKSLHEEHAAPWNTYPFTLRTDEPSLRAGGVNAVLSAIYVPEPQVAEDARVFSALGSLSPSVRRMKKTFERDGADVASELIDSLDAELRSGAGTSAARSLAELDRINREGKIAFLHTLEGGHALASRSQGSPAELLPAFHARGVCMVTLAHFYDVGVAPNIQGVPKTWYLKALGCFREQWASESSQERLPKAGRACVEAMLDLGMLIDLTHMTPESRADVLDQAGTKSPLVMSHVGCYDLMPSRMNPRADEIRRIADTGGVIGVIFLNYFLNGKQRGKGIDAILATMDCLMQHGGEDCVGWGSDFDGFTNPPNDLTEHSDLPRLVDRMLSHYGERTTAKLLGGNVRRVLEEGWKSPV
jgi:membrane dipeptidase